MGLIAEIHKDLEKGALQLIVEYRDRLKLEAVKLCGDNDSAEDLVFRTFERVLAKVDTYKDDINLFAWMKTIMENIHRDDLKRPVNRRTEAVAGDELERYAGADWSTDEQILRDSDSEAIREAIAGLDPKYHQVLLMRYYDEFSMKQIASILRLPLGTVTRRVQIAHRLLAGKLSVVLGRGKKPLAVFLAALVSIVSAAAVTTLPAFEPLRETVASWFGSDAAPEEDIRDGDVGGVVGGGGVSPAQTEGELQKTQSQEAEAEEIQNMKLTPTLAAAAVASTVLSTNVVAAESPASQPAKTAAVKSAAPVKLAAAASGGTRVWTGATSGDWHTPTNWDPEGVPTADDDIVLAAPGEGSYTVTASQPISVRSLTIGSAGAAEGCTVTFESQTAGIHQIKNDLLMQAGGKMTHAANTTVSDTPAESDLVKLCLSIGGNATVESGAVLDVSERGYKSGNYGPGKSNGGAAATHGGRAHRYSVNPKPCYDSIERPTMLGSSGRSAGGGVVRLDISGALVFNGILSANGATADYYSGAGGSIWISAASLSGGGTVEADGGPVTTKGYWNLGGAGGRISITVGENGLGGWQGMTHTHSGALSGRETGGCAGTVYRREGTANGVVVVENDGGAERAFGTDIPSVGYDSDGFFKSVEVVVTNGGFVVIQQDAQFGGVFIEKGCEMNMSDFTLTVDGSFKNVGTLSQSAAAKVVLTGSDEASVIGSTTFENFECREPGKTLRFATGADNLFGIAEGGSLTLCGAENSLLALRGVTLGEEWNMKVGSGAVVNLEYLDVEWSVATNGEAVAARKSLGGEAVKHNFGWKFPREPVPGETNTWLGVATSWQNPSNWSLDRLPVATDAVSVPAGTSVSPVLDADGTFERLVIAEGASLALGNFNLSVGKLEVAGRLVVSGGETITVVGDMSLAPGNDFSKARVILSGSAVQHVSPAGLSFDQLAVLKSGGSVTFDDGFSAGWLRFEPTAAVSAAFASGKTVVVRELALDGRSGALILGSTDDGDWKLNATGVQYVTGVTVSKSDASGGATILADATCTGGDDSRNWMFNAPVFRWTGAKSTDFRDAENWWPNVVPGEGSNAVMYTMSAETLTAVISAGEPVTVSHLLLWAPIGKAQLTSKARLVVKGDVEVRAGGELALDRYAEDASNEVSGDLTVAAGGLMTHSQNATAAENRLYVHVAGDATVEANGSVNVQGRGFSDGGPAKSSGGRTPSHGGRGKAFEQKHKTVACYGSVECPITLGSSGWTAGGGAVRLSVDGTLTVDGEVNASGGDGGDYYNGAGGSVWFTCGALAGSGSVKAHGGCPYGNNYNLGGGGGRVSVRVGEDGLAAWGGHLTAWGGWNAKINTVPGGYAGTVCVQEGNRPATVIVDNNGGHETVSGQVTELGTDWPMADDSKSFQGNAQLVIRNGGHVTLLADASVGDIMVEKDGYLTLDGHTLSVNGSFRNFGTLAQDAATKVVMTGTAEASIAGAATFSNFSCTVPGKMLVFGTGADDLFGVSAGGTFVAFGDMEHPLTLVGEGGGVWKMKLGAGVEEDVHHVAVSNSDAGNGGISVSAKDSNDLGGNKNWSFSHQPHVGDPLYWTGLGASDEWMVSENWRDQYGDRRLPEPTDRIVITNGCPRYPIIENLRVLQHAVEIGAGASLRLSGGSLTTLDALTVSGTLELFGTETVSCSNAVTFALGATFVKAQSTFQLIGDRVQAVDLKGQSFNRLEIRKNGGAVSMADGFSADFFVCEPTTALTIAFAAGKTVACGMLTLAGASGGEPSLELVSTVPGVGWILDARGAQVVTNLKVSDSDADGHKTIYPDASCVSVGEGNRNWMFGGDVCTWTGAGDGTTFLNADNWNPAVVPGPQSQVRLFNRGTSAMTVTLGGSVPHAVAGLTCLTANGTLTFKTMVPLTVAGDVEIQNGTTWTLATAAGESVVSNNLVVGAGGTVNHLENDAEDVYHLRLRVLGNAIVAHGGSISVKGKGFATNKGPGKPTSYNAPSHGGRGAPFQDKHPTVPCYGSIEQPMTLGSGGSSAGGGAIRLVVDGDLTVNGAIDASGADGCQYYSGAGGSIWITCGKLLGGGSVQANGGICTDKSLSLGGGGRIAVYETQANDFTAWQGHIVASGGWRYGDESPSGFAGSVCQKARTGRVIVTVDNNGGHRVVSGNNSLIGMDYLCNDRMAFMSGALVVVRNGGHLTVVSDAPAADVSVEDGGYLTVSDSTLTIKSLTHKNGKGWARAPQLLGSGEIVWKSGFMLMVK